MPCTPTYIKVVAQLKGERQIWQLYVYGPPSCPMNLFVHLVTHYHPG